MVQKIRAIVVKFFTSDGKFSFVKVGTQLVVLVALVLGLVAFVGNNKTVTLNVDGKVSSVQTFGGTVGQVVKGANLELQPSDRITPAADSHVRDGSVINVNLAKAVKVSLDGAERTISTTSPTVEGLVTELGVASASELSVPKDAQLAVSGSFVSISTPKSVSIVADGKADKTTTTAADRRPAPRRRRHHARRQRPRLAAGQRAGRQRHGDQGVPRGRQPDGRSDRSRAVRNPHHGGRRR